jgi:hypothetical protein
MLAAMLSDITQVAVDLAVAINASALQPELLFCSGVTSTLITIFSNRFFGGAATSGWGPFQ